MAMSQRWRRAVSWAAVAALGAGLAATVVSAQQRGATVTAYGFELSCDANVSEGSTLACTLSNTSDEAADWPAVGIVHLSSDDDRALVVGSPVDVAFGALEGSPETEDDVWWIGDVLVGYSRFDWDGQATASSESETTDSRTVNIVVADDTAWEQAESFYVALAPSGARGVGFLYDSRQKITIPQSDSKSSDATLASLVISAGGTTTKLTPPPSRHSLTAEYTTTELTVAPTATYKPSGISVAVDSGAAYSFAAESGDETRAIPLAVGINTISVTVTAENGTSSEAYEVMVTRASLVDGATVTASSDEFSLTCPGTVAEGSTMECTLTNLSTSPADWPVVAFLHSSADGSRALIAEDPIIPESSLLYSQDIRLTDPQVPVVDNYNYGYGELFSGGSRSVYATYGYEKFDWLGPAEASTSRNVFVEILADDLDEGDEIFYAAIADSAYTGLSNLVDNKVPIVVRGTSSNSAPTFPDTETGQRSVVEGAIAGRSVGAPISATDPDGDTLVYSLQTGGDVFDIHAETGQLLTKAELDYETATTHSVVVAVSDGKDPDGESDAAVDATVEVTVSVIDANEPPALSGPSAVEFVEGGDDSVGAYAALDPDGDEVSWSVGGADAASFEISAEGVLRFLSPPDFDAPGDADGDNAYQVQVRVTDGKDTAGESDAAVDATVEVTVSVIDANEPPALSGPSAVEFVEGGDDSVGAYAALDPDGDEVSWSVGGADAASFEISAEGVLRFLSPPDFDAPGDADGDNAYQVQVRVTDGKDTAGESDAAVDATVEVTVSVIDANEPPALSGPSAVEFVEGGDDSVGAYAALDPDGDEVSWSVGGADAASFEISAEGVLRFLSPPDFDAPGDADGDNAYQVQVRVTDGKDTAGESDAAVDATVEVTVSVIDANEPPALSGPSAVEFVEGGDDSVGAYAALDPDGDEVSWSVGGADAASFEISAEGVLRFLSPPDFDAPGDADGDNAYQVQVRVTDGKDTAGESDAAVDATVEVTVSVIDANEPPTWSVTAVPARVVEGAASTVTVSVDKGFEVDQTITLAATGGTAASGDYSLSSSSLTLAAGDMSVTATVTAVDDSVIEGGDETVVVTASHGGGAVGSATVTIEDNDTPVWSVASAFSVVEGDTVVATLSVTDADTDVGDLVWSVAGGVDASEFSLSASGVLAFSAAKDFEAPDDADGDGTYEVTVRVSDGARAATANVEVSLANRNEAPTADAGADLSGVAMGATVALAGSGTDPDAGDVLAYAWTQTSGDSVTLVDAGAATASFDAPSGLTYDATLVFTLTVTDAGGLPHQDQVSITVEAAEVLLSSDGQVEVTIEVVDGDLNYSVALGETMLLARSAVGLAFSDDVDAVSDVTVVGGSRRDVDTTWTPVWGKSAEVVDRFSEITVQLQETATAARRFDVVFRAYDDGVAFRYTLASQDNLADGDTVRERTEFNVAANWPIHSVGRVERPAAGPTLSDDFATSRTPALVLADSGVFAIHEAGLLDYPELRLTGNDEKSHALLADVNSVSFSGSLLTPWRVLMVATEIGELLETQILETLSPSLWISDSSFIQPGKAIWDWRVRKLTYDDVNYGVNTATYIHMIDFAAENNIAYLAIDAGWYGSERSATSDPTTAIDGLDIAAVLAHAENNGVRVILYINDHAFDNHVMEEVFETWSQWGVAGVKYGFMGETFYSQDRVVKTVTAIETAAEHRLLINFHDSPVHPTGLQRTYPNLITVEYAHAQHDDVRAFSPVDFLRTIFVNMLAGPLDMNNGFFDLNDITRKANSRPGNVLQYPEIYSTVATEVARTLITNTGLTVLPDAAEAYLEKDGMFEFIRQMPNARWDETRVLNAEFGDHVTVAKRHGRDWFVGSVIDESGGSLDIDLGFLDSATTYAATIYKNASDSHYMTNREAYDVAQTVVTASDTLTAVMAPGGGHAVWLRPETAVEFTSPDVFEMAENGTLAGRVIAEESGSQYRISDYTLTGGADQAMFEISDDGALSFTSSPDYEQPADAANANEYVVTVEATGTHNTVAQTASQTITVRVLDVDDTAVWSVVAGPARVVEGAVSTVTVSVDKEFEVDQTITLAVGGTAASGDYSLSSSSLTLAAGDMSVTATVTAVDDSVIEGGDETVVVTASHGGGAVGSATVTIQDNDTPTWSVVAGPARVAEGAASTVTVSVDKEFEVDQTITLAVGGTAASGDYSLSSSSLTLAAGDTSVTATVTAVDDSDEESDETVVVTASHGGGAVGSATVTIEANDTPVSTDAALSSLALSGVSIGDFDAGITAYAASVGNGVSSTTVTAVASDDGASVVIADGDGETQGTSRSVSLVVGDNEITVTVTAEDAATTKTYTVTVARAEPAVAPLPPGVVWGDRLPDRDIALPGASSSSGVWSDGTDVWVVTDTAAGKISVYSLADGAEHTDRGFTLPGGAEYAAGLWSDGATLWVADVNSGSVRAYRLSDGARQADRDLDTAGNGEPAGIWSDGTTMWAADFTDSRVYAYDLTTKARVADKELDLDKNPGETYNPFGIWSNADTLLAASWFGGEIIAHSLADGQRQPAKDLSTYASRTNFPNGIWSNGHILWVVDASAATLYAYAVPGLGTPPNDTPVWSVTAGPARVVEGAVSTVTVSVDKEFEVDQTITLAVGGTAASGDYSLSSSLLTLDAGDMSVTASVTAVDDSVIEGGVETVVVTASHGGGAVGSATVTIEDNDTAVWSVVAGPARVVEGAASTVTVSVGKEFEVDQTITLAVGGTAASGDYSLSSSLLTLAAGDMSVTASVTAVDDSVIEGGDETVVVTASHGGGAVGSATVTIQDNDTAVWSVVAGPARVVEGAASTVTVSVDKEFEVDQTITLAATGGTAASGDYSLSSSLLTLAAGDMSVTATVTAVDDSVIEESDETVVVTASHGGGAVGSATVTIEDADTPTWSVVAGPARVVEGAVSTVTVSVDKAFEVDQTITLAVGGTAASGDYSLSSSSLLTLAAGDMSVTATVTAVDDSDEESDETVVVTASHGGGAVGSATVTIEDNDTPVWSVTAVPARVVEGAASTVTVSVDKEFEVDQTITLAVGGTAASGDYSLSSSLLTLDAGDMSVTATVTAVDDSVIEGGDETVVVTASHGGGAVGSATVTIQDNDTPTWSVTAVPARVVEGAASTVTVSVDKEFEVDQTITLAVGGTAASGDYSLSSSLLTLAAGDMSVTATVTAVDDSVIEGGDETVVVTASHGGGAVGSATVTIQDNDTAVWSVTAGPARVVEGAVSTVTVSVDKEFEVDQTITLAVGGTAASGDYSLSSSSLTLAAGDMSVTATVTAVDDSVIEGGDETVVVTASHGGGAVGSATVTIQDNDTPTWSVVAGPARVAEGAASTVTVSVDKEFEVDQTITLAVGGTAASGDYSLSSSLLTLAAGDMSVTASVTAVDDSDEESDETVVVTASHGGGAVGSATVTIEANDTPVSTDAALSSLALSGVSIGDFDAGITAYAASVGNGVSSTTVTAVASDDGASVVIGDGDGETQGTSRSVSLVVGDNEITVTVTAEDAATTKTYTVTVARAEPDVAPLPPGVVWGDRLPDRDIALPGASSSSGVWSDGTDVWVVTDTAAGKISVYSLADGAEHTDRGFTLPGGAEYAAGLWSDGATLWVADVNSGSVRAYRLSDGARQADRDLDTAGNGEPAGIWSDGTTMWAADFTDSRVYAYDLTTKARVADKELDLDKNPGETYNPFGIWSNADTLLAASWLGGEIIAHSLADGQRQPAKDLSTYASRTNFPNGIWSNGHILWVVDASAATLYAYAVPGLGTPPNDTPVWSVTAVPARVVEGAASTVTVSVDKEFEVDQTITLAVGGTAASGDYSLSSSLLTLAAGDMSVTASVTAVDDSVIEGGDETVVVTASHGGGAVGSATVTIQDNDTAVWSVTAGPARVAEGAASTVTVSVGKEFEVDQTITLAVGGTAASGDYSLSSSLLTLAAGDMSVTATVTAVDDSVIEGGVETVVVTASHGGGAVGSATVTIEDNDTAVWSVTAVPARVVEGAASTVTVSVGKEFEVDQTITLAATGGTAASGDYSLSSSLLTLDAGDMSVTATVTAVDDSVIEGGVETVVVTASHGGGAVGSATVTIEDNDTAVWSVTAVPARVAEGAASTVTVSVDKEFEVDQTITLAATGGTAASGDYSLSSSSLTLDAGDMSVTATVTAVDDSDEESDETVVVTASHGGGAVGSATVTIQDNDTPTWSVTAVPARVVEGAASTVTVSVDKEFEVDQTITLAVGGTAASGDYSLSSSSLTLAAGDTSVTATVTAVDDSVIEGGDETVVVTASHGGGAVGSATVTIQDNDTPTWSVTAVPARVVEGAASTVTVSVDKEFEVDQTITLAATGGTAASGDYSLSSSSLTLDAGDTSVTATVTAVDDSVIEGGDETVVVTASHGGGAVGSATVTIQDNDTPTWSVTAVPARVVEGAASTVTVSVDKEFEVDQTITLAVGGTAASGDYSLSSSSLTLAAGDMSVTATVTAVDDSVIEGGDETVVVTASHGGGAVGSATVTIEDNDTPTWSVTAVPARVVEGAASTVTVSVDKEFEVDQTITLAVGGTAASGDYSLSSSSLTLAAGDTSVTASVTAVDDSDEESDETVVVTASHGGGAVGSATVTIEANDTPVSTDAALSSLALSGVSIGDFDAGITAYAASVGNGVSSTTVTAVASDDGASVVIADGDGETQGTSRSVSLVVGDNEITVTVTAEDAATTKTYTVTVARAEPDVAPLPPGVVWGDRLPDRDIALPGASSSSGVWSDGTDVWVVTDTAAGKISVYSLADGAEHTDRGFTLPGGAEYAAGLWSDGATLWVADVNSGSVRAYRLSDGARQADRDLDTAGNGEPAGIWSDGTTMWVADFTDSRVYAYDLTTKARVADKELDLDKNPGETYNPFGIWSNADTLLAASWLGGEIIAHSLADGQRQPAKDLSTYASRTYLPNGIWSNGHILWVVDASAATLYAYAVPGLGTPPNDTAG